jgi:hypothetical protein
MNEARLRELQVEEIEVLLRDGLDSCDAEWLTGQLNKLIEAHQAESALAAAPGEPLPLLKFAERIVDSVFEEGGNWDGLEIQEWAEECGLIQPFNAAGPCGESCGCEQNGAEWPVVCFRKTALLRRTQADSGVPKI